MTNYATTSGIYDQTAAALQNSTALGQAYDASKTDDSFYLPPEAFTNPEFQRGLKLFLSPDGHAARMIIPTRRRSRYPTRHCAHRRHQTRSAGGRQGHAPSRKCQNLPRRYCGHLQGHPRRRQIRSHDRRDRRALSLILLVMMFITRSLVAALVIVGTVALSMGASSGFPC